MSLHHRLFLLRPRLSASPAVARGRLPRVAVAVVSVTCRLGGLDAMVSQTLSSLVAVNGVSRRSGSRWPDSASGLALLRLAAVNGLQSCGPALGIDSMQSVGAWSSVRWWLGGMVVWFPVYCSEPSAASMCPRQCPYCIVYGLYVGLAALSSTCKPVVLLSPCIRGDR